MDTLCRRATSWCCRCKYWSDLGVMDTGPHYGDVVVSTVFIGVTLEAWTHCVTGPHYGDVVVSTVLSGVTLEAWTHCHRATLWCCSHKYSAYGVTLEAWTHCVTGPHYGVAVISTEVNLLELL